MAEEPSRLGRVLRPEPVQLPDETLVPATALITPPPDTFSHEVVADEPYWFAGMAPRAGHESGVIRAGTRVLLVRGTGEDVGSTGSPMCAVADARGLYVTLRSAALRRLE